MSRPNPTHIECEICGDAPDAFSDPGRRPLCPACRLRAARAAGVEPLTYDMAAFASGRRTGKNPGLREAFYKLLQEQDRAHRSANSNKEA
jgi:hypothetical protein